MLNSGNKMLCFAQQQKKIFQLLCNPNNPVVILLSLVPHPAKVPIEGAVLFKLTLVLSEKKP